MSTDVARSTPPRFVTRTLIATLATVAFVLSAVLIVVSGFVVLVGCVVLVGRSLVVRARSGSVVGRQLGRVERSVLGSLLRRAVVLGTVSSAAAQCEPPPAMAGVLLCDRDCGCLRLKEMTPIPRAWLRRAPRGGRRRRPLFGRGSS